MRVLAVYDCPNWAIHSQAQGLINNSKIGVKYESCSILDFFNVNLEKFDIIFFMCMLAASSITPIEKIGKIPFVALVHHSPNNVGFEGQDKDNPWLSKEKEFSDVAKRTATISKTIQKEWLCEGVKTFYLPSGIDANKFKPHKIGGNKGIKIGWVGNKRKALKHFYDIILPAIDIVKQKHNVTLESIGYNPGSLISHDNMPAFYKDIDLYVCASSHEGLPTPLVEACACGIPFVSTDVGVIKEINLRGYNCVVERDTQSLANGIIQIIEDRRRMAIAGEYNRHIIKSGWSWDTVSYIWEYFITGDMDKYYKHHEKRNSILNNI